MPTQGMKKTGFRQGIHVASATQREAIGTLRMTRDGRCFRYSKNGGVALVAGHAVMPAANDTDLQNEAAGAAGAAAVGATAITFTAAGVKTLAADYFKGGTLSVIDGAGQGHTYMIEGSAAVTASATILLTLAEPLRYAIVAADEWDLAPHPNMGTVVTTGVTVPCVGVAHIAVPIGYWYWAQTRGPVAVLNTAGSAIYEGVGPTAAGSVVTITTALDVDQTPIGKMMAAAAAGDYGVVNLFID